MISRSVCSSRSDVGSSASSNDRLVDQGAGDRRAALLARRHFRRIGVEMGADAQLIQQSAAPS